MLFGQQHNRKRILKQFTLQGQSFVMSLPTAIPQILRGDYRFGWTRVQYSSDVFSVQEEVGILSESIHSDNWHHGWGEIFLSENIQGFVEHVNCMHCQSISGAPSPQQWHGRIQGTLRQVETHRCADRSWRERRERRSYFPWRWRSVEKVPSAGDHCFREFPILNSEKLYICSWGGPRAWSSKNNLSPNFAPQINLDPLHPPAARGRSVGEWRKPVASHQAAVQNGRVQHWNLVFTGYIAFFRTSQHQRPLLTTLRLFGNSTTTEGRWWPAKVQMRWDISRMYTGHHSCPPPLE